MIPVLYHSNPIVKRAQQTMDIAALVSGAAVGYCKSKGVDIAPEYLEQVLLLGPATLRALVECAIGIAEGYKAELVVSEHRILNIVVGGSCRAAYGFTVGFLEVLVGAFSGCVIGNYVIPPFH